MIVYFDSRSATLSRTTGWERYVKSVAPLLQQKGATLIEVAADSIGKRLLSDARMAMYVEHPSVMHFPTFPPLKIPKQARLAFTLHDLTYWKYPELCSHLGRRYYKPLSERAVFNADVIFTHSHAIAVEAASFFDIPIERFHATGLGVDPSFHLTPHFRTDSSASYKPYILTVGTIEPRKNLLRLIAAYNASGVASEVELVVCGREGWESPPKGVRLELGASDARLRELYRGALGFVSASLYEGFGLPVAEALVAGLPVACSRIAAYDEVAAGFATFFDPLDVESIAAGLRELVNAPVNLPASSLAQLRSRFSWQETANIMWRGYGG